MDNTTVFSIFSNQTKNYSAILNTVGSSEQPTSHLVVVLSRFGSAEVFNVTNIDTFAQNTPATWDTIPILTLIVTVLTLLMNTLLLVLLTKRNLRTSFTVYLLVLCVSNLLYTIANNPFDISVEIYGKWLHSSALCDMYLYGSYIVSSITMHCHALITANRLWAISFPVHYKNHHSRRFAMGACGGMCLYVHAVFVPYLTLDALYYRYPVGEIVVGCLPNIAAQQTFSAVTQTIMFDLPIAFIVVAYPFLWYKHKKLRTVPHNPTSHKDESTASHHSHTTAKKSRRSFRMLTLLTGSIFLCWTIAQVYDTVDCFYDIQRADEDDQKHLILIREVGELIYSAQAALDPLLFIVALKDLREAALKLVHPGT